MNNNKVEKTKTKQQNAEKINRRDFLKKTAVALTGLGLYSVFPSIGLSSKSLKYPFQLGIASGDPLPNGVVLWTRLAPRPLLGGGMPTEPVEVNWEISEDPAFNRIFKKGTAIAQPEFAHSVHIEVENLHPNEWYYYRFKANNEVSPVGRTKTAPAYDTNIDELNFAFISCQKYTEGFYTAYDHLLNEDLDLVFFLGDYIYEYGQNEGDLTGREHWPKHEIKTLLDYRIRYGQYKSDPSLQAAHAAFPWIVTPDDHEVKNDYAGYGPPYENNQAFLKRREAAFQAYYEHMPLRPSSIPTESHMQLYRNFKYGNLASFNVLDTRQFRTNFACNTNDDAEPCEEVYDPSRTMLGAQQEQWLFDNLAQSTTSWNVLPQQVRMAYTDKKTGPGTIIDMDKWDGYIATRERLFNVLEENKIKNMVVLTGDSHENRANNLHKDFKDPDSPILATELMGTSIASSGDGSDLPAWGKKILEENPHIKFMNHQRGYVHCKMTPEELKANFRVLPYVSKPGAPIQTRASFKIDNNQPGVVRV